MLILKFFSILERVMRMCYRAVLSGRQAVHFPKTNNPLK